MDKKEKVIAAILLAISFCNVVALLFLVNHKCPLPTAVELQTKLVEAGYDIEIDGQLGRKTTEALRRYHEER